MLVAPPFELDQRALVFSLAVAMISALVVGLGPALQTTRVDLTTSLKAADRGTSGRRGLTARSALVAAQVVFSLVLMTVAVFSIQVFGRELRAGPGFRTTHMAKLTISASQARYSESQAARFFTHVLEEARALPGVRSASLTSAMPMFTIPFQFASFVPEGRELPEQQRTVPVWANCIDDRYFETMGIEVLAGRVFTAADDTSAPPVAIVNDALARHYFPDDDAIGKRLQLVDRERLLVEIVGVVKSTTYLFPGELPQQGIFFPYRQQPRGQMTLLTHTAGESAAQLEPMRDLVNRLDPDVPVFDLQTIEAFYDVRAGSPGQVLVNIVGAMGVMGITLTMVGLYGLVSYAVNRRTREIGIRIAVGASYRRIIAMVLRQGIVPAWLGLVVGLLFSSTTTQLLTRVSPLRYQIGSETYFVVVQVIFAVTLIAAYIPARRAARVDPTVALRAE